MLAHELTLSEGVEFVTKRAVLATELVPLHARAHELSAQVKESASTLAETRHLVEMLEQSLRESEQRNLSLIIALLAMGAVGVFGLYAVDLSMAPLAAVSGFGMGWLLSHRKRSPSARVAEEEPVTLSMPRELLSIVVPLSMLVLSPVLSSMGRSWHHIGRFPDVVRMSVTSVFVMLGGIACCFGRRGKLLAVAMIIVSALVGFEGWGNFAEPVNLEFLDDRFASIATCFSLPLILAGQWAAAATRGHQAWRVASVALLAGSAWSTWWLMTAFIDERVAMAASFTSFAGLALELSIAAGFFAFESTPGSGRRVLVALAGFSSAWTIFVFAVLHTIRFN